MCFSFYLHEYYILVYLLTDSWNGVVYREKLVSDNEGLWLRSQGFLAYELKPVSNSIGGQLYKGSKVIKAPGLFGIPLL